MEALRTVTDRFSLIDKIRRFTPQNDRNYLLRSVRETFASPEMQERIQLGEMFGYYGHGRRAAYYARTGRLNLPEFAVVMIDGKPVTLENVPSNRTLEVSVDDNGIVTHVQEILDTDPGNIIVGINLFLHREPFNKYLRQCCNRAVAGQPLFIDVHHQRTTTPAALQQRQGTELTAL